MSIYEKMIDAIPDFVETTEPVVTVHEKHSVAQSKIDWFGVTGDEEPISSVEQEVENISSELEKSNLNIDAKEFEPRDVFDDIDFPLCEPADEEEAVDESIKLTVSDEENKSKYFYFYQGLFFY